MITAILSDFSRVLLFPRDESYTGGLNKLNKDLIEKFGENYDFFSYFKLNVELLDLYKFTGKPIYIFTSDKIQDRPEVRAVIDPIVTKVFSAKDLNLNKDNPESYEFIANAIGKETKEILYIDDLIENIKAAEKIGMSVLEYRTLEAFKEDFRKVGI